MAPDLRASHGRRQKLLFMAPAVVRGKGTLSSYVPFSNLRILVVFIIKR